MTYSTSENNNQQKNLQYFIGTIIRRRKLVYIPLVLSLIISVLYSFIQPKYYESYSTVLVSNKRIIDPLVSEFAVPPDIHALLKTLSNQVMTWPRLEKIVKELKMVREDEPVGKREKFMKGILKRIMVDVESDEFIKISFTDRNPEVAKEFVNRLTMNFIRENAYLQKEEAKNAIKFIGGQLKIYKKKLELSQGNFSTSKIVNDLRKANNRKKLLEDRIVKLNKIIPSRILKERSPLITQLSAQLGIFESELAIQMIDSKRNNPRVKELKKIIAELKRKIRTEKQRETIKESISIANPAYLAADQELKKVEMEISHLEKRKNELRLKGHNIKKPVTEEDLAMLERDKTVDEDIYQMLLKNLESAYVSKHLQDSENGNRFNVIEYARLPIKPASPKTPKVILVGLLLGAAFGVGLVFFVEYVDKSFLTVEDAKEYLPLPVAGAISNMVFGDKKIGKIKKFFIEILKKYKMSQVIEFIESFRIKNIKDSRIAPEVVMFHDPQSRISEEYRVLRTNISGSNKNDKVIMVTSPAWNEGKTTTAVNLATSFAMNGKKTVLVDCDLRKGTINDMFSLERKPGFVDVIKGETEIYSAITESGIENLSIMSQGSTASNPAEIIESDGAQVLFDQLKKMFDVIIVDSPPLLNMADTTILGKYADTTLMAVQMERTQRTNVIDRYEELTRSGIKVGGFVLTKTRYYMPKYLYNYYYGRNYYDAEA
jgi:capsular exopolysaccharide synthesis family protein